MIGLWLRAFVLTVAVESAIAVPLLRGIDVRLWRRAAVVFFANLASHPAVWFIFPALGASYATTTWISEGWAIVLEAIFFCVVFPDARRSRLVGIALLANGASWAAGMLVRATTGWIG